MDPTRQSLFADCPVVTMNDFVAAWSGTNQMQPFSDVPLCTTPDRWALRMHLFHMLCIALGGPLTWCCCSRLYRPDCTRLLFDFHMIIVCCWHFSFISNLSCDAHNGLRQCMTVSLHPASQPIDPRPFSGPPEALEWFQTPASKKKKKGGPRGAKPTQHEAQKKKKEGQEA